METINQTFHDASNALWKEIQSLQLGGQQEQKETEQPHGEEPIAGIQGKGTATDPYDAGNREDQPGSPDTKENTAVIPESLASITPPEPEVKTQSQSSPEDHASKSQTGSSLGAEKVAKPFVTNLGSGQVEKTPDASAISTPPTSTDTLDKILTPITEQKSEPETSQDVEPAPSSAYTTTSQVGSRSSGSEKEVSEEALKGPKCPPPREPYKIEKQQEEREIEKREEGQGPKPGRMLGMGDPSQAKEQNGNGNGHHAKESGHTHVHLHKMKEKLSKVVKPHLNR